MRRVLRRLLPTRLRQRFRETAQRARNAVARSHTVDEYRYLFVVTYGRSGSTLLMGLLNTIPGYRIHGENNNALYRLYQAATAIEEAHRKAPGGAHLSPRSAWYGMPRARPSRFRQDLVDSFVTNVLRPGLGDRVLGFKEIRHSEAHIEDLTGYLSFLRQTFPGCRIVFNHRRAAAVARSGWWSRVGKAREKVEAVDARLSAIPADDRHFHFTYDDICDSLANIRALFRFLGEELDEQRVRQVLGAHHGPPSQRATDDDQAAGAASTFRRTADA